MMNNTSIPKPEISPNFTIDDIHKIREYNYQRRKHMTNQERIDDINAGANQAIERIEAMRRARNNK
jgi:uncharacterized protein (UPF0305 family)